MCVIGVTDVLDGYVARRTSRTESGGILDPLADEFAVVTGILCLLSVDVIPLWFAALVFWSRSIFGLVRILSLTRGGAYAAPRVTTKVKMGVFYVGEGILFGSYALGSHLTVLRALWFKDTVLALVTAAIAIAVVDFVVITHRHLLLALYTHVDQQQRQ